MISLGIDVGTTHTKVLALDIELGTTLALAIAPTPTRRDADGEAHQPADILETVVGLITQVLGELEAPGDIRALCVASVGEEVVLLDAAGRPLGDALAWYDPRGRVEAAAFMAGAGREVSLSKRWPPDPTFSIFKLMWTREHRAHEFGTAASWTDLGDYVLAGLGGDVVMDWSHASRAGAFDLVTRAWDPDSIAAAGLNIDFPRLVPSGTIIGTLTSELARRTGLPIDVSIVTGGHDHLCAAFGAGVRSSSELFLSAGTSEAHLAPIDAPILEPAGRYRIDQGCYVDESSYYAHINIHSGHYFQQWRGMLYAGVEEASMYEELEAASTDGVHFELDADLMRGRFDDVPYSVGRAVLMRAVLEGLTRHSAEVVAQLERASGRPYELILVAGHPTRVPLWRSMRTAAYGRTMAVVEEPESAAFGAAVLAARAVVGAAADHLVARRSDWSD